VQQSLIISILHVGNNFNKKRVTVKSRDRMSALFRRQTSKKYNNTGMHLLFTIAFTIVPDVKRLRHKLVYQSC